MHGSRKLVVDKVRPFIKKGAEVLDVCSGDGEITEHLEQLSGKSVMSVDFDMLRSGSRKHPTIIRDVSYTPWYWAPRNHFDVVTCFYALQHVWGDEASIWREVRRVLKPGGLFITVGRFAVGTPVPEVRFDPGRSDNQSSLAAMGLASGLRLTQCSTYRYTESGFNACEDTPNVHFSVFQKGSIDTALAWSAARLKYRIGAAEGWMHDDELAFLYAHAAGLSGGTVVEIGGFRGKGSVAILAGLKEGGGGRLAVVDTFDGYATSRHDEIRRNPPREEVEKHRENTRLAGVPDAFYFIGRSMDPKILGVFEREGVDWVFIDGDHSKEAVAADILNWLPKVARGGVISGHDYHPDFPGVIAAVDGSFGKSNVSIVAGSIWMTRV